MGKRLTVSRTGQHEGYDRFDRLMIVVMILPVLALDMVAVNWVMDSFSTTTTFVIIAAVLAPLNVAASRVTEVISNSFIRPRVFDREQRHHEIVPAYLEDSHL